MFPPFPQELARHYCMEFISGIEDGSIILKQISQESEERKGHGIMVGALVCVNAAGERVVLHAVSGISVEALRQAQGPRGVGEPVEPLPCKIIVPPLVPPEQIEQALAKNDKKIHELTDALRQTQGPHLKEERTKLTTESLLNVFGLYTFTRFDGKRITLNEIIRAHDGKLPPTGTGDCCAPKLLSYAFEHNLTPISMDEVFYGRDTKNKTNGTSYPPCDERCGYILPYILGLEILYRDNDIVVINKQAGLLSVAGRGEDKQECAESRVRFFFPEAPRQCAVHRLDMETSGILVLALNSEAHRRLNEQFAEGKVHKKYIALLEGILHGKPEGRTELPFRLDTENRPHQIYDKENGKIGITEWKKISVEKGLTRIEFTPLTGRTHQLRLAASCPKELGGLGIPIAGDTLYGNGRTNAFPRLMLHAAEISFVHPSSGRHIHITCPPGF